MAKKSNAQKSTSQKQSSAGANDSRPQAKSVVTRAPIGLRGFMTEGPTAVPMVDNESRAENRFTMIQRESIGSNAVGLGDCFRLVEVDKDNYSGPPHAIMNEVHQLWWMGQINGLRPIDIAISPDTYEIWRSADIEVDEFVIEQLLQFKIDEATKEAIQAALFVLFNTCEYDCDLQAALDAIGYFIHALNSANGDRLKKQRERPMGDSSIWALYQYVTRG